MTYRVLFVGSTNVCRSPTAAWLAGVRISDLGLDGEVAVSSGGVAASPGSVRCSQAVTWATSNGGSRFATSPHEIRQVDTDLVLSAGLVLAVDRDDRAGVIHLAPAANGHTFTLREAGFLASVVCQRLRGHDLRGQRRARGDLADVDLAGLLRCTDTSDRLTWLATEMNAARGLVPLPGSLVRRRALWRLPKTQLAGSPLDISDPHLGGRTSHSSAMEQIRTAVNVWADCLDELFRFDDEL